MLIGCVAFRRVKCRGWYHFGVLIDVIGVFGGVGFYGGARKLSLTAAIRKMHYKSPEQGLNLSGS